MNERAVDRIGSGLVYGAAANVLWGVFPLYFLLLAPAGAFEIVAWRVLFSLAFCALALTVTRSWRSFGALLRRRRVVLTMGLAGALIYVNWQTYVLGTLAGRVVETALGYFTMPLVTALLGVLVLHERLRRMQWVALALGGAAVLVIALGYGEVPWIAIVLALSFGAYGLVKRRVRDDVDAPSGLALETLWLAPVAVVQLVVVSVTSGLVFGTAGWGNTVLLMLAGVVTAVPLLLFASAARRLPLTVLAVVQYIVPVLQFVIGVWVLHEPMPLERWLGFGIVWLALVVFTVDLLRSRRPVSHESLTIAT
ncbi:EamA family transporter RarD [Cnuibacter physcomitrellae]|uniref:EamA family transporter RarD n=1 Tax=Cnuibacter physcomitrellae TaxID=1619308 RepID=UPI002175B093|nr:EamA family transporter RarD [Cnuibacter physcomitrellae]MCS5499241.1 EamA family transporter RarD [Cnuibacter physcomitrellae]